MQHPFSPEYHASTNETLKTAVKYINPSLPHILEFGVYKGSTMRLIRDEILASSNQHNIFGFDSFEGLSEDWTGTVMLKGDFHAGGVIPDIDGIKFYKGWFVDTIPEYIKDGAKPIGLLHIDSDLYSSATTILESLNDCIVKDTIIVFDEWYYNCVNIEENRQHEQRAFFDWVAKYGRHYWIRSHVEDERIIIKME